MDDGSLMPRSQAGAVLADEAEATAQALRMARDGEVVTASGKVLKVKADTICIHGDTPKAIAFAQHIRQAFLDAGVQVTASGDFV